MIVVLFDRYRTSMTIELLGALVPNAQSRLARLQAAPAEPDPRRWIMLPVVLTAMFMAGFDIWAVNVAAPSLQRDLHVSDAALQLIVGGYAFMYASGMVTGGRLGDLFGYRRMFMIGVVSFAAASLLCGLAQSPGELVTARLAQGLTGAAMVPQVLALITATFPVAERSRALAWFGVTMGLGFVSGQILGGGLIEANIFGLGWRAIFLVNVPVGVIALVAAALVVPHAWAQRRPRLDPLGALGVSASIALALVPLTLGRDEGWPPWTWASLAACLPMLGLTLLWERRLARRSGEPLLDLPLFRDRTFSAGLAVNFGLVFFFGSFMFVLTLLLQAGLGQPPLHAGIEALPMAATFTLMSILSPRFSARLGSRSITLGAAITTLGAIALALTGAHYGAHLTGWDLAPATAAIGLGQGIALPSLIGAVLTHVRPERSGAAAGILTTTQQFGAASGIAVIGAIFYGVLGAAPSRGTFVSGMVVAMTVNAALVAGAAAVTLLLPRRAAVRREAPARPAREQVTAEAREQVTAATGDAAG
jgi:EmrB/QacA subfamily drug resistance transporter